MKRIVKLIAVDNRYKQSNYPYRCIYDEGIGTYLTGQHIDPNNPDTHDNLTTDEMTGAVKLSEEKKQRFPYVINPVHQINLFNNQSFDLSTNKDGVVINHKDAALHELVKSYGWFVAKQRDLVQPKVHYFYIFDEIFEAEVRVQSSDLGYEAEKYIREEVREDGLRDIALVLNYKVKEFSLDPDAVTKVILKDAILEMCRSNPKKVLECKLPGNVDDLFILKLARNRIIQQRGTDFYDESEFIGKDLDDVKRFIKLEDNAPRVSKWNRLLAQTEKRAPLVENQENGALVESFIEKAKDYDMVRLRKIAGGKRYPRSEWDTIETEEEMVKYLSEKLTQHA